MAVTPRRLLVFLVSFFSSKNLPAVYYKKDGVSFGGSSTVTATPHRRKKEFLLLSYQFPNSGRRRKRNNIGVFGDNWREAHLLRLSNAVLSAQMAVGFHCQCAAVLVA